MSRFRITVAYDGRFFAGWQSQPDALTVQDTLESAIAEVTQAEQSACRVHGSGRTDAGVHAFGQVAHFDVSESSRLDESAWQRALNARLPATVRVMDCVSVSPEFHARFSAIRKTYEYRIYWADVLSPLEVGRAWHLFGVLDLAMLRQGLQAIEGRHDFSAFTANRGDGSDLCNSRERTIFEARLIAEAPVITLRFTGEGFLYKMVRLLTGGLVRCAQGREPPGWFTNFLENPQAGNCPFCAPASGLYLVRVEYT